MKEFNSVENVVKKLTPAINQNYDEFCGIVKAMRILTGIKIDASKPVELTEFLAENRGREKIAAKILSQSSVMQRFDPLQENQAFTNLIFDLLVTCFSHLAIFSCLKKSSSLMFNFKEINQVLNSTYLQDRKN